MPVKQWNAAEFVTHDQRLRHAERAWEHWRAATNAYHWLYGQGQFGEYLPYRKLEGIEIAKFQRTAEQDLRRFGWNTLGLKEAVEWLKAQYPSGYAVPFPTRPGSSSKGKGKPVMFGAVSSADASWQPAPTIERDYNETFRMSDAERAKVLNTAFANQRPTGRGPKAVAEIIFS